MSYPPAFAHARSSDDDNPTHPVQLLGFRRVLDEPDVGAFQDVRACIPVPHHRHGDFLRKWGIQKNIDRGQTFGFKQGIKIFENCLRAL